MRHQLFYAIDQKQKAIFISSLPIDTRIDSRYGLSNERDAGQKRGNATEAESPTTNNTLAFLERRTFEIGVRSLVPITGKIRLHGQLTDVDTKKPIAGVAIT